MAKEAAPSHKMVRRIWTAFGLRPHRRERFKLSSDPLFVDKVRDIVGLYLRHDRALRRARRSQWIRHRQMLQTPAGEGVPALPQGNRHRRARRPRHPHRHGQLRHPQNQGGQGLAGPPSPISCALHPDLGVVDQSDRTVVRRSNPRLGDTPPPPCRSNFMWRTLDSGG